MFTNYKKECEHLRTLNEDLCNIRQEQAATMQAQRELIAFLDQELSASKKNVLELFNQQTENEKTIAALQQDNEDLRKKAAHLDADLGEALRTIMNLENQVNSSRASLKNLCATLDDKDNHIQALDETLGKVQRDRDAAEAEIAALTAELTQMRAERKNANQVVREVTLGDIRHSAEALLRMVTDLSVRIADSV